MEARDDAAARGGGNSDEDDDPELQDVLNMQLSDGMTKAQIEFGNLYARTTLLPWTDKFVEERNESMAYDALKFEQAIVELCRNTSISWKTICGLAPTSDDSQMKQIWDAELFNIARRNPLVFAKAAQEGNETSRENVSSLWTGD